MESVGIPKEPIGIPAFVINLQRRPDRLELFMKRCPLDDVFLVPGFDAQDYSSEPSEDIELFLRVHCEFPGESAVFVSHIRILKEIIERGYAYGLIFEDDAQFHPRFLEKYQEIIKEIPENTYILYIGGRFTLAYRMKEYNYTIITDHIVKHKITRGFSDKWDTDRTAHAYIISNTGARQFLDYIYSLEIITRPIDDLILNFFLDKNLPVYNTVPLLCHSPAIGDSDIRPTK